MTSFMIEFSQKKYSQQDTNKNCEVYPTNLYETYKECDKAFVFKTIRDLYPFTPVWAADDLNQVTKKIIFDSKEKYLKPVLYYDLFDGTVVSPCPLPCTSTQMSGTHISTTYLTASYSQFSLTFSQTVTLDVSEYPVFELARFLTELGGAMGFWFGIGIVQLLGHASFLNFLFNK